MDKNKKTNSRGFSLQSCGHPEDQVQQNPSTHDRVARRVLLFVKYLIIFGQA